MRARLERLTAGRRLWVLRGAAALSLVFIYSRHDGAALPAELFPGL